MQRMQLSIGLPADENMAFFHGAINGILPNKILIVFL